MRKTNRCPGFTLVEMLVVIGLLTASFAIAIPALSNFSNQFLLKVSARSLASDLRFLQTRAILRHKTLSLNPAECRFPSKIKLVKGKIITFSADGFPPPGGSGSIVIQNTSGKSKKIVVSSVGRVRIE